MASSPHIFCSKCGLVIPSEKNVSYWNNFPCDHTLCSSCLTRYSLLQPFNCPVNDCFTTPEGIVRSTFTFNRRGEIIVEKEYTAFKKDPCINLLDNGDVISIDLNNEESKQKLPTIFAKLKDFIIGETRLKYKSKNNTSEMGSNVFEQLDVIVEGEQNNLLNKCITALAFGEENPQTNQKQKTQIFVACENIKRVIDGRCSDLRHLVTRSINVLGESHLFQLLQRLGISYARQLLFREDQKKVEERRFELKTLKFNKHSYAILVFDNLGFKNRQGSKKGQGYNQFTVIKVVIISPKALGKAGIYKYNGEDALSRASVDWADLRDSLDDPFESVVSLNSNDNNLLAQNTINIYSSILELESKKVFPSDQTIRRMLIHDTLETCEAQVIDIPSYTGRDVTQTNESFIETDDSYSFVNEDPNVFNEGVVFDIPMSKDLNAKETVEDLLYYALDVRDKILNGIEDGNFSDEIPILEDQKIGFGGDGSPIIASQRYMASMFDDSLSENETSDSDDNSYDNDSSDDDEMMEDLTSTSEEIEGKEKYRSMKNYILSVFGGFHLMLELYKKIGSLFEHTHLRHINTLFRKSTKAVDFVLNPSDPNQSEGEMIQRHLAFILTAIRSILYLKTHGYWEGIDWNNDEVDELKKYDMMMNHDSDDDDTTEEEEATEATWNGEVTVEELVKFIIYRASRNPQTFVLLLEMRFDEVIFLLQRAEYIACAKLYCTAMKFALLLAVNANASNYVEMICNFFIERYCMSESMKKILDKFILFRKTKNGKNIFSDRFVEWTMRDVRQYLGKYFKKSTTNQLEKLLLSMKELKDMKNVPKPATTSIGRKSKVKMDKAFLEPYCFYTSANVWLGEPKKVQMRPYASRVKNGKEVRESMQMEDLDTDENEGNFFAADGQVLFCDVLSIVSRGVKRASEYFKKFHVDGEIRNASRAGAEIANVSNTNKNFEKELEMCICVDEEKMKKDRKIYTKARVCIELNSIIEELSDMNLPIPKYDKKAKNKGEFVAALVSGRKEMKAAVADWEEQQKARVASKYEAMSGDPFTIIKDEIQHPFFCWTENVRNIARDKIYTFSLGEDDSIGQLSARREFERNSEIYRSQFRRLQNICSFPDFPN